MKCGDVMRVNLEGVHCLVMGGSGFIGMNLCRALVEKGAFVRSFSLDIPHTVSFGYEWVGKIEWISGNFGDTVLVRNSLRDIDIIFHLIDTALPAMSNDDILFDVTSNLLPTIQLLDSVKYFSIQKVIFISSGGTVYGIPRQVPITEEHPTNPICAYGIHKLAIEKYLHLTYHLRKLDYAVLRVSNPYGENQPVNRPQGVIANFVHKVVNHEPLEVWGDGSVVRDYIYIDDVIDAFLLVVGHQGPNRVFNIGSGIGYSLLDLISMFENLTEHRVEVRFREARGVDVSVNILDAGRAMAELNWSPTTDLETGMRRMLAHAMLIKGLAKS
jgi:UDP-glucose 4-epimerase